MSDTDWKSLFKKKLDEQTSISKDFNDPVSSDKLPELDSMCQFTFDIFKINNLSIESYADGIADKADDFLHLLNSADLLNKEFLSIQNDIDGLNSHMNCSNDQFQTVQQQVELMNIQIKNRKALFIQIKKLSNSMHIITEACNNIIQLDIEFIEDQFDDLITLFLELESKLISIENIHLIKYSEMSKDLSSKIELTIAIGVRRLKKFVLANLMSLSTDTSKLSKFHSSLIKFQFSYRYLCKYSPTDAKEVQNTYQNIMKTVYNSLFKDKIQTFFSYYESFKGKYTLYSDLIDSMKQTKTAKFSEMPRKMTSFYSKRASENKTVPIEFCNKSYHSEYKVLSMLTSNLKLADIHLNSITGNFIHVLLTVLRYIESEVHSADQVFTITSHLCHNKSIDLSYFNLLIHDVLDRSFIHTLESVQDPILLVCFHIALGKIIFAATTTLPVVLSYYASLTVIQSFIRSSILNSIELLSSQIQSIPYYTVFNKNTLKSLTDNDKGIQDNINGISFLLSSLVYLDTLYHGCLHSSIIQSLKKVLAEYYKLPYKLSNACITIYQNPSFNNQPAIANVVSYYMYYSYLTIVQLQNNVNKPLNTAYFIDTPPSNNCLENYIVEPWYNSMLLLIISLMCIIPVNAVLPYRVCYDTHATYLSPVNSPVSIPPSAPFSLMDLISMILIIGARLELEVLACPYIYKILNIHHNSIMSEVSMELHDKSKEDLQQLYLECVLKFKEYRYRVDEMINTLNPSITSIPMPTSMLTIYMRVLKNTLDNLACYLYDLAQ